MLKRILAVQLLGNQSNAGAWLLPDAAFQFTVIAFASIKMMEKEQN
jgi:hypothetical protein